jgi:hypothetical protein
MRISALLLFSLLLMSCKKDATTNTVSENKDSVAFKNQMSTKDSMLNQDSLIANSSAVEKVLDKGINRDVDKNEIVRTADASMLPFEIGDEFTDETQKFKLKLANVSQSKLKISIETRNSMNIRINQIKKPDGSFDGPFGQALILNTPQKGEYWIIIGKDLMADGGEKGHFSVKVE